MAPVDKFCYVFLLLRNWPVEVGKLLIYVDIWMVLNNTCLGFWGTLPSFTGAKNCNFGQNFRQGSQMAAYYSTTGRNMEYKKQ